MGHHDHGIHSEYEDYDKHAGCSPETSEEKLWLNFVAPSARLLRKVDL